MCVHTTLNHRDATSECLSVECLTRCTLYFYKETLENVPSVPNFLLVVCSSDAVASKMAAHDRNDIKAHGADWTYDGDKTVFRAVRTKIEASLLEHGGPSLLGHWHDEFSHEEILRKIVEHAPYLIPLAHP